MEREKKKAVDDKVLNIKEATICDTTAEMLKKAGRDGVGGLEGGGGLLITTLSLLMTSRPIHIYRQGDGKHNFERMQSRRQ